MKFQSSPHLTARCNSWHSSTRDRLTGFNPHLTLRQGATSDPGAHKLMEDVSILTSPYGKVQHVWLLRYTDACRCFNPHLTLRQGATGSVALECCAYHVSILTSPYG